MNIEIQWQDFRTESGGWIRRIFTERLGWAAILLWVTLAVTELYYLNVFAENNTRYLLGPGTFVGLLLLIAFMRMGRPPSSRVNQSVPPAAPPVRYVKLKDDYLEQGIAGFWFRRFDWRLFTGFKENDSAFVLEMAASEIVIEKAALPSPEIAIEIRELLKAKQTQEKSA